MSLKFFASLFVFFLGLSVFGEIKPQEGLQETLIKTPQTVMLLNSGLGSLQKRLLMIRSAKKTIDVEYFIYNVDEAGRVFTQALLEKIKEGVKVRVIVDYTLPILQLKAHYVEALQRQGFDVRYYNQNSLLKVVSSQYRSHRKTLVIDGGDPDKAQGLTGGRNISNEYFDLDPSYNFLDTDIYVKGRAAQEIFESFNLFWSSSIVESIPRMPDPSPLNFGLSEGDLRTASQDKSAQIQNYWSYKNNFEKKMPEALDLLSQNEDDRRLLSLASGLGQNYLDQETQDECAETLFVADLPGKGGRTRFTFKAIEDEVARAQREVLIESPYFIMRGSGIRALTALGKKNVKVQVLTNSLHATDAFYTIPGLYSQAKEIVNLGVDVHVYSGEPPLSLSMGAPGAVAERWGTHSKRALIDGETLIVGTFNADPRSKNLNAEMVVICRGSPKLGQAFRHDYEKRLHQSVQLNKEGLPADGRELTFNASFFSKLGYYISYIPAQILEPLF